VLLWMFVAMLQTGVNCSYQLLVELLVDVVWHETGLARLTRIQ
jgi:hypothetical protein